MVKGLHPLATLAMHDLAGKIFSLPDARQVEALNEPVVVTANGEPRQITKREAVIAQLVDKSTGADLRATKMLIDMLKDIEKRAGMTQPPAPSPFTPADEEVVANLIARLRRSELMKTHHADMESPQEASPSFPRKRESRDCKAAAFTPGPPPSRG